MLTIAAVMGLLGVDAKGPQHRGPCPLHGSQSGTSRCFSCNTHQNLFHCFKCGAKGDALDLWAKATGKTPYDAAWDVCERLGLAVPLLDSANRHREEEPVHAG